MQLLRSYSSLDSTNSEAHRLLSSQEAYHGLAILAFNQTEGRGQYGRVWQSQAGQHLAMSIILQPDNMTPDMLPLISMKASLGIIRVLHKVDPRLEPKIKWPNDIYLKGKKLAGILIENSISVHKVQHCIIGIGMNVNEDKFSDSLQRAISLRNITRQLHDIEDIAAAIRFEVLSLIDVQNNSWKTEYDQLLFGLGETRPFEHNEDLIEGKIHGVNLNGKLCLDIPNEGIRCFASHELRWIL